MITKCTKHSFISIIFHKIRNKIRVLINKYYNRIILHHFKNCFVFCYGLPWIVLYFKTIL